MSKDTPDSGFLSKMVKFVRYPATSWSDLDLAGADRDAGQSQQALKEMIERKRRNDFVRKREFDMLRKLRARVPDTDPGYGARPSFFQSSYSSRPDDRAGTLKKIDEIEAQMSMQWWKNKHGDNAAHPSRRPVTLPPPAANPTSPFQNTVLHDPGKDPSGAGGAAAPVHFGPTQPGATRPTPPVVSKKARVKEQQVQDACETQPGELRDDVDFPLSQYYALDVQELALDPEIEEAAIRYASGDDQAAVQGLLDVLTRKGSSGTSDEWMALFDLYRATGNLAAFDDKAMDFANRFSRSAPQWYSMPAEVAARTARVFQPSFMLSRPAWVSSVELDTHAVTLLIKSMERVAQPCVLDWSALGSIQPVAAVRLHKLFTDWAAEPVDVRFFGARRLRDVLQAYTPSGDNKVDRIWWDLRLAGLRVMNLAEDFELAALDFCVTFELSPPSWDPPKCHFKSLVSNQDEVGLPERRGQPPLTFVDTTPPAWGPGGDVPAEPVGGAAHDFTPPIASELMGEILGDPMVHLERLDRIHGDALSCEVSCRHLIRVDFSASGGILNWVSAHHALGREIRFTDVHRLIAAFFHVIGITEYAKVVTRND